MPARRRKIGGIIMLTCLVLADRHAAGQAYVTANGSSFQVCNQTLRFMGFNLRGICHYGRGDALPYSHTSDIETNLDYCVAAKATVIRVFCAYHGIDSVETGDRLQTILDACQDRGMWAIVALTDMYYTGLHPQGDDAYYTDYGSYTMLNHSFFAGGYTVNYLPQAVYLADRFKDHPALFAWQVGNEIRDLSSGSTFLSFCQDMTAQIWAVDPNHMLSAGVIGSGHIGPGISAADLYAHFDFVNSHNYNGGGVDDSGIANQLNKPYLIDEAGFDSRFYGPDRTPEADDDIDQWINDRGAEGYMNWGLMASSDDNGDGDWYFGVDWVLGDHEEDFDAYRDLFNTWGTSFETPPALAVEPTSIEQTIAHGHDADDDTFTVRNTGSGSFTFDVTESIDWLWVSPAGGSADCFGTPVIIHYDSASLVPGAHVGQIKVTADGIGNSPQYVEVTLTVEGTPGDFDGDGDVDQEDFGQFQACLSGPGLEQDDPACEPALLDPDVDVDQDDFAIFEGCISGPNVPADPSCAD